METGTLFLDKSAFEALSRQHAPMLQFVFVQGLVPTLVYEVLADLTKPRPKGTSAEFVQRLAAKFGGGGGMVNMPYQELLVGELLGAGSVPMTGQLIPQETSLHTVDGEAAGFVDISAFNRAIVRWSHGHFDSDDLNLALAWRSTTRGLSLTEFCAHLGRLRIPFPRPRQDLSDLLPITDGVIGDRDRQGAWVQYLLEHLQVAPRFQHEMAARWRQLSPAGLADVAPYTLHCLRALVAVSVLWGHRLTKREPNNYLDVQYLYYLPFCQYFGTADKLQRIVAPLLMRPDQSLLNVDDLRRACVERKRPDGGSRLANKAL